jgi:putative aldouronate transport system substrate-binding protein
VLNSIAVSIDLEGILKEESSMKKKMALLLAAAMTVSSLAGCGSTGADQSATGNAGTEAQAGEAADGVVTLKWVTIGSGMPENYDSWVKQVNDYAGEKIGVNIEMEVISWGDWDNRRNIVISTNEPYDIIFGNGGNFVPDIQLGAYYDITDLVKDNMPGLMQLMPEEYWEAVTVDGKIYGVPTYKDSSLSNYDIWDKEESL